jgi:hypothetical protein
LWAVIKTAHFTPTKNKKMKQSIKLMFILLGGIATAQTSFTWSPNDTIIQDVNPDLYTELLIEQINISGDTLELGIEVVKNTIDASWDGMICLQGLCLGQIRPEGFTSQMTPISGELNGYTKLTVYPAGGTQSGELRIRVFDLNNPSDGDTCTWIVNSVATVGFNEVEANYFKLYPNPSTDFVNIESDTQFNKIEILDMQGRIVVSEKVDSISSYQLNISNLNSANYIVRLYNGKAVLNSKNLFIND